MAGGYIGRVLFVDLSSGELSDIPLDEKICRKFIGGYGIGARLIYDRLRAGVDPLGPENILGFMTGPLTGTDIPFGSRCAAMVGKSPLTDGWGDSNAGGSFGPYMKFAGYDGVFFIGKSVRPVYLYINSGKPEIRYASHIWGKDTVETADILVRETGKRARVASIGPAGEKLSLISCIVTEDRRIWARSGIGAVMGSKKLKAVVVNGNQKFPVADSEKVKKLRREFLHEINSTRNKPIADMFRTTGTSGCLPEYAYNGDCPVKNWGGIGSIDFKDGETLSGENVLALQEKKHGCYRCPLACSGVMKAGEQYPYKAGAKKPEYETMGAFGPLCLNKNLESIIMLNDICDRFGMDTMSAGVTIAFAIECYENGIITEKDTNGIELSWGNHEAIVELMQKMVRREGFGDVLADGSRMASGRIGKGSEKYAMHVHGQEIPMHDPRLNAGYANCYVSDPTPGRHVQAGLPHYGNALFPETPRGLKFPSWVREDKYKYNGKGKYELIIRNATHLVHTSGVCWFSWYNLPWEWMDRSLNAVTGWQMTREEIDLACERISALRQAFNIREGLSRSDFKLPGRVIGDPPLKEGPCANITVDVDTLVREYYEALDWDPETGKPSKKRLLELGLNSVAKEL
jgi:aldehyde:ferredoxin oxidoreductase